MSGKRGRKKKVEKLDEHEDLYGLFGEEDEQAISFGDEFDQLVTEDDLKKAAAEKVARAEEKPPCINELPQPQAELDLHGFTADPAERRVRTFLGEAAIQKLKTVRIITGKGLHSDGPAVLPDVTELVLQEQKSAGQVVHYRWDKKLRQKSGAVIVYLR